jgi:hypothetical protein
MIRTFALVYGIVFVVLGIAGFIPGFVVPDHTGMETQTAQFGEGLLLGLFPTNAIHNIFHLLWGIWGILSMGDARRAWIYATITAAVYILLSAVGWAWGLNTALGVLPLHGNDVWLHLGLGLVALAAALTTHGSWRETVPEDSRRNVKGEVLPAESAPTGAQTAYSQDRYATGMTATDPTRPPGTPTPSAADPHGTVRPQHDKPGHDKHRAQGSY